VDAAAHRGALSSEGVTVAFLAGGVDSTYPKGNTALFDRIAADGLLVSELPPGCSPTQLRFLARNRLIAAATRGTVVAEAAARSGSLNTANWASRLHRTVLGVPGPVTSTMSEGVHALLRAGEAILVTDVAEILEAVAPMGEHLLAPRRGPVRDTDELSEHERRLLDAVPVRRPAGAPQLAVTAGVALTTALRALEQLQARGLVERADQGWRLSEGRRP
jgi:DNA processing protein